MTASVKARRNNSFKSADRNGGSDHKEISARRLTANRRNARNSTGPRTPAGKAVSCKNAIRHGLTAELVLHHESREEFDCYRYAMLLALDPRDPAQLALADRVISCEWRLRRIGQAERHILYQDPFVPDEEDFDMARDAIHLCQDAGGVLALSLNKDATLEKLSRYEQRLVNQSHRALRELKQLQSPPGRQRHGQCDPIESIDGSPCPYVPQWFIEQSIAAEPEPLKETEPAKTPESSGATAPVGAPDAAKMQNEPNAIVLGARHALINSYEPVGPGRRPPRAAFALCEDSIGGDDPDFSPGQPPGPGE